MNNTASACEGLNQLATASVTDDDEASEQLVQALASKEPFPINLAWIVPLLSYKHISSLTTHLKRHFEQDEHFQKYSSGGARTHTYKISIFCFREICQYARHSQRRTLAQYWIKVIDDVAGGDFKKDQSKLKYKKIKGATNTKKRQSAPAALQNIKHDDEDFDEDDEDDYEEDTVSVGDDELHYANNNHNEDYHDIESESSLLSSLSAATQPSQQHIIPAKTSTSPLPVSALYNYNITTSTPPKPRVRKDFASVSILNRKRKYYLDDPALVPKNEQDIDDGSAARPNLRLLSELALGLR